MSPTEGRPPQPPDDESAKPVAAEPDHQNIKERLQQQGSDVLRHAAAEVEDLQEAKDPRQKDLEIRDQKGEVTVRDVRRYALMGLLVVGAICGGAAIIAMTVFVGWAAYIYFCDALSTPDGAGTVLRRFAEFLGAASFTLVAEHQVRRAINS